MDAESAPSKARPAAEPDVLEAAAERIWLEIRGLLPRHRFLLELARPRTAAEARELGELSGRLRELRRRSARYRAVLRAEAWARWAEERRGRAGERPPRRACSTPAAAGSAAP